MHRPSVTAMVKPMLKGGGCSAWSIHTIVSFQCTQRDSLVIWSDHWAYNFFPRVADCSGRVGRVRRADRASRRVSSWCEPRPMCTIWTVLPAWPAIAGSSRATDTLYLTDLSYVNTITPKYSKDTRRFHSEPAIRWVSFNSRCST